MAWINPNQLTGSATEWMPPLEAGGGSPGLSGWNPNAYGTSDGYQPNWWGAANGGATSATSTSSSAIAQFISSIQQYIANLSQSMFGTSTTGTTATGTTQAAGNGCGPNGCAPPAGPGVTMQDGTLSSTGDPHLAVTGTAVNRDGSTRSVNSHFDSMTGHTDLLSSNDFGDGFDVATTVTPMKNGVTTNASATATMNGGNDSVSMSLAGGLQVTSGGTAVAMSAGQTVTLSGGEQVTENQNGSVTIAESNASGGTLATTFTNTGGGIDVTAQAHDVTLHGDLVTGGTTPATRPVRRDRPAAES